MTKRFCILCACAWLLMGCSSYQKLLKNGDADEKYSKAVEYFNAGSYQKALSLFEDVSSYFKGTDQAEDVLHYVAQCYLKTKDNTSAGEYYKTMVRNYPRGKYAAEAKYMIGHCLYLDSPDARLDQTQTKQAIAALEEFLTVYPNDSNATNAQKEWEELTQKLSYKELLNARLYRNLGTYRGDNYMAAIIVSKNALQNYPQNPYSDEFAYITLQCKVMRAQLTNDASRADLIDEAVDEYYSFINDYPESKFRKDADKMGNIAKNLQKK